MWKYGMHTYSTLATERPPREKVLGRLTKLSGCLPYRVRKHLTLPSLAIFGRRLGVVRGRILIRPAFSASICYVAWVESGYSRLRGHEGWVLLLTRGLFFIQAS